MKEPRRFVLYARGRLPADPYTRIQVLVFEAADHALTWLQDFLGNEEYTRDGNTLHLAMPGNFNIKSDQLEEILAAKLDGWELPLRYERGNLRFKYGPHEGAKSVEPRVAKVAAGPERERRPDRPPGYVTIGDLCAAAGLRPLIARAALRASGRPKPSFGWAFDPKEVPAIKALVGIA